MNFQESNPSNSRIFIDYRNKKNPVRFEYPNKKSAFRICLSLFLEAWVFYNVLLLILFVGIYTFIQLPSHINDYSSGDFKLLIPLIIFIVHFFFTPVILAGVISNTPSLLMKMPEISRLMSSLSFEREYYKKISQLNKKTFEIPVFSNNFLDYKAGGDFSKYLYRVVITELEFEVEYKTLFAKKKKRKNLDYVWKATFYFTKIPKNGELEIWFR